MALELTPALAGKSLIVTFGALAVSLVFQVYMLYLNWKQSKVKNTQERQIELLENINMTLNSLDNKVIEKKK